MNATGMHEFDEDTAVEAIDETRFRGRFSTRWSIGPVPNGGYVLAVGLAAVERVILRPDPISVTAHFLRPAMPGEVEIRVDLAKRGKRYSTASASLIQSSGECLRLLATYGDLSNAEGPKYVTTEPPELPPLEASSATPPDERFPEIAHRFDTRYAQETMQWIHGHKSGQAEIRGWTRFRDGRKPDTRSLVLFADAFPPPVFNVIESGWVPTIELTVHVRARPASDWLRAVFRTRFVFGGHLEEDGEIWDETGTLVALSRQIAIVPRV